MKEIAMQWIAVIALLVFVYLVVFNGPNSTKVIGALSSANTNAILALQGRNPTGGGF